MIFVNADYPLGVTPESRALDWQGQFKALEHSHYEDHHEVFDVNHDLNDDADPEEGELGKPVATKRNRLTYEKEKKVSEIYKNTSN